ncbi:MAG: hypothetical protein KBF28_00450 [Gemmatimonadales bacterium]|jgi:hypothetical protein|nr:hypothetical protein [Gemmatimonadales bacterium]
MNKPQSRRVMAVRSISNESLATLKAGASAGGYTRYGFYECRGCYQQYDDPGEANYCCR